MFTERKRGIKTEPFNGDDDESMDELFPESEDLELTNIDNTRLIPTDSEERQLSLMEKLVSCYCNLYTSRLCKGIELVL